MVYILYNFGFYFLNCFAGVLICGLECLMSAEWKSSNKIIARSVGGIGKGDIIVTTLRGGRGSSTVQFKGLQEAVGPLKVKSVGSRKLFL